MTSPAMQENERLKVFPPLEASGVRMVSTECMDDSDHHTKHWRLKRDQQSGGKCQHEDISFQKRSNWKSVDNSDRPYKRNPKLHAIVAS